MSVGYCYMCDAPAAADPCPGCGRPLPPPAPTADESRPAARHDQILSPDHPPRAPFRRSKVPALAVGTLLLVVILLFLRSEFGV